MIRDRWALGVVVVAVVSSACEEGTRGAADASAADAGDASPDAMAEDTGAAPNPTAVHFEAIDPPADGPLRVWGPMVAPIDASRAVVFGGTTASQLGGTTLDGTWLYDASSGALEAIAIEGDGPAPRYCGCAAYDPDRGRVVLTGGRDLVGPENVPAETWELDLEAGTWTQVEVPETPGEVVGCMLAYSRARGAMYLFGGGGEGGTSDTIHRYDPEGRAWITLDATGPSARYDGRFLPLDDETLMLYGGAYSATGAAFFSDVWLFDAMSETWSEVVIEGDVPPGRRVSWTVLEQSGRGLYVATGFDGRMQPYGDFWYLDLEEKRWTELALPDAFAARAFTAVLPAAAPALGTMLGGYDGSAPVTDVWVLMPGE